MSRTVWIQEQPLLFHSTISPLLSLGLFSLLHITKRVEHASSTDQTTLIAAVEFVRVVIGHLECISGVYRLRMLKKSEETVMEGIAG